LNTAGPGLEAGSMASEHGVARHKANRVPSSKLRDIARSLPGFD
jgi:hypothetical protein